MIAFGLYLRSVVYYTCREPEFQWRVIGLSDFLMLDTIALLTMMSMVLTLLRSSQMGVRLLDFSFDTCEKKNWSSDLVMKSRNLLTSIVCVCSPAPSLASNDLVAPPGRCVLRLLSRPLCLQFQEIRFQVSLLFAVIKSARLGRATAWRTPAACMIAIVAGITPVAVFVIHNIGEA